MLHVDDPQLITLIPREGTETLNNLAHHIIKRQGIRLITLIPREGTETFATFLTVLLFLS